MEPIPEQLQVRLDYYRRKLREQREMVRAFEEGASVALESINEIKRQAHKRKIELR